MDITKQRCCIEWFVSCLYNYVHFPDVHAKIDKALLEGFQARITVGSSNKLVVVNYIDIQLQCPDRSMLSCLGTATTYSCTYMTL